MTGDRIVTFGETMALMHSPDIGSLAHVTRLDIGVGGAESNVAIALARLGTAVTWVGRVGPDPLGERVIRELRAERVDVRAIVDAAAPTGLMIKERRTSGVTRVFYYRNASAGSRLTADDLDNARIAGSALVHLTGITAGLSPTSARALETAMEIASAASVPISFDVNHRAALWVDRDAAAVYRRIAIGSDIVFAGLEEARMIVGGEADPADVARAIGDLGPRQVLIKLGDRGCVAWIDGTVFHRTAANVRVIDTVGAGDAFVAGYLAEFVAGEPIEKRLSTAISTGAFACMNSGDWEGYPTRAELALLDAPDAVIR